MPSPDAWQRRLARLSGRADAMREADCYFYEPVIERQEGAHVWVGGRKYLNLVSYAYLGITSHQHVVDATIPVVREFGFNSHGSRIVSGTTTLHISVERRIAHFLSTESAMVIGSGLTTNTSVVQSVAGKGDVIFYDRLNHTSLHDGCRISGAALREFSHEDLDALGPMLDTPAPDPAGLKFVIIDGVFSMDGDLLDLPKLLSITRPPNGPQRAIVMVDEAHSFGVLGKTGRGITEHFGIAASEIDILMGVLSKAIPSVGGFIAGTEALIRALKATNHGYIFSGALPPSVVEAARAGIDVLEAEPWRVEKIHANVRRYCDGLRAAGFDLHKAGQTAIVPILCRKAEQAFQMTRVCREQGVLVTPVTYPAVPINAPRIRTTITAAMGDAEIDQAVAVLADAARQAGVIE